MVEQKYVQIPEKLILEDWVQDGYKVQDRDRGWLVCPGRYRPKTSFKLPMKAGNGSIAEGKVRKFSGPNSQKRQCEIAEDFKLKDLGGFVVPYLEVAQKGGGPSGELANSTRFVFFSHSQDPVGYFGCVDADKELAISNLLLKAGFPSCEVLRIIKLDPQRLIEFMSEIWSSDIVLRNLHIDQINKIIRNGDKPALIYRHMGMNVRLEDYKERNEAQRRINLAFNRWSKQDKSSYQAQVEVDPNRRHVDDIYTSIQRTTRYYRYLRSYCERYLSKPSSYQIFFPGNPEDACGFGVLCDYEIVKANNPPLHEFVNKVWRFNYEISKTDS